MRDTASKVARDTGAVASMPTTRGRISPTLPAASIARTSTVWVPSPVTVTSPEAPGSRVHAPPSSETSRRSTLRSSDAVTRTVAGSAYQPLTPSPATESSSTTGATASAVCIRMKVTEYAGNS